MQLEEVKSDSPEQPLDGTPRDEVTNVLGQDRVEKLGPDGDVAASKIAQE